MQLGRCQWNRMAPSNWPALVVLHTSYRKCHERARPTGSGDVVPPLLSLSVPIPSLQVARRQTGSGQEGEPVGEGAEPPGWITFWKWKKRWLRIVCGWCWRRVQSATLLQRILLLVVVAVVAVVVVVGKNYDLCNMRTWPFNPPLPDVLVKHASVRKMLHPFPLTCE